MRALFFRTSGAFKDYDKVPASMGFVAIGNPNLRRLEEAQ